MQILCTGEIRRKLSSDEEAAVSEKNRKPGRVFGRMQVQGYALCIRGYCQKCKSGKNRSCFYTLRLRNVLCGFDGLGFDLEQDRIILAATGLHRLFTAATVFFCREVNGIHRASAPVYGNSHTRLRNQEKQKQQQNTGSFHFNEVKKNPACLRDIRPDSRQA